MTRGIILCIAEMRKCITMSEDRDYCDLDQAARMIAALRRCRPEDRMETLAVVCKVYLEGHLDKEPEVKPKKETIRFR